MPSIVSNSSTSLTNPTGHFTHHVIASIYCDQFEVACERLFNPRLRSLPVLVLEKDTVISCSTEAQNMGIYEGVTLAECQAQIIENKIVCLQANDALYMDISQRVMETLFNLAPSVKVHSSYEAFLTLEGDSSEDIWSLAHQIRSTVARHTGISVTIGLGTTQTLAQVACLLAQRYPFYQGIFDLSAHPSPDSLLSQIRIEDLCGVESGVTQTLHRYGLSSILDLKFASGRLRQSLPAQSSRLITELQGIPAMDFDLVREHKRQILGCYDFDIPAVTLSKLQEAVGTYTVWAAESLRLQQALASSVHVFLKASYPSSTTRTYHNFCVQRLPSPTETKTELLQAASQGVKKIYRPNLEYRKVGVILKGLVPKSAGATQSPKNRVPHKRQKLIKTGFVEIASSGFPVPTA